MNTYNFSYDKILDFLNNVPVDSLESLYTKYDILSTATQSKNEQLAEAISDQDMMTLGFQQETEVSEGFDYKYSDVKDIAYFLAHCVDDFQIEQLMKQYNCIDFEDLALALTDAELDSLNYSSDYNDDLTEDCCDEDDDLLACLAPYQDYDERFDFLEDIPGNINVYVVSPDDYLFACDNEEDLYHIQECVNPVLVDEFALCEDLDLDTNKYVFQITPHQFEIQEDVVINDKLNPALFDDNHMMLPDVKEKLINYVNGFAQTMTDKDVDIDYSDICLVGSNAGYLYTPESDIDIHMISSNPIDADIAERLFNEFDLYEAESPLMIGNAKVELGIEDGYEIAMDNLNPRRYSLVDDTWVDDSDKNENYKPEDISAVDGYEEVVADYEQKIKDVVDNDNYAGAVALKAEIRNNRSEDLAHVGALSMGNVVFKELRNNGSYGVLKDYITSKELAGDMFE